jgi:hypothetical protein
MKCPLQSTRAGTSSGPAAHGVPSEAVRKKPPAKEVRVPPTEVLHTLRKAVAARTQSRASERRVSGSA